MRRRIVGKPRETLVLSDYVDSGSVPDSFPESGMPEALESSDSETKKRRVESFHESVDWFQREKVIHSVDDERLLMNEKYLRLTLVILWNLSGPSVEIHRCGCQRDCQMGNRAR